MLPRIQSISPSLWVVFFLVVIASGCAKTPQILKYETDPVTARIWPQPPETPRYRYVGTLTGEANFEKTNHRTFAQGMGDFFRWIVGLGNKDNSPRVLQRPQSGAVDARGRILVTDISRREVMVFDAANGKLDEWKMATAEKEFLSPVAIAVGENGTTYVTDSELGLVTQLDEKGNPIKQFGREVLNRPTGIARDPKQKQIYVADTHDHNIKIFSDDGKLLDILGKRGIGIGEFNSPTHLTFADGKLIVTDTFNTRIQILDRSGEFSREFGQRGLYVGNLIRPKGVTTDSDGNIYVIESYADYLLVYNPKGEFLLPIGGTGAEIGQFYLPSGVWSDDKDRIYIADMFNGRVVILQYLSGRAANNANTNAKTNADVNTENNAATKTETKVLTN
jgi:DNA-binding beta-propeller fold protein YncE